MSGWSEGMDDCSTRSLPLQVELVSGNSFLLEYAHADAWWRRGETCVPRSQRMACGLGHERFLWAEALVLVVCARQSAMYSEIFMRYVLIFVALSKLFIHIYFLFAPRNKQTWYADLLMPVGSLVRLMIENTNDM